MRDGNRNCAVVTLNGRTISGCTVFYLDEVAHPQDGTVLGVVLASGTTPMLLDIGASTVTDLDAQAALFAIARRHIVQAVPAFANATLYACADPT